MDGEVGEEDLETFKVSSQKVLNLRLTVIGRSFPMNE